MDELNWRDIQVCLAVAHHGTIAEAARELEVSPSTVYRRMDAFEERLGVVLFDRHARGCTLTDLGEHVLSAATSMRRAALQLRHRLEDEALQLTGTLVLDAPDGFGPGLTRLLAPFLESHPGLRLRMRFSQTFVSLAEGEADVVIRVTNAPSDQLWGRRLGTLRFQRFASPEYARTLGGALERARWVVMDREHRQTPVGRWEHEHVPAERVVMETPSRVVQLQAVACGLGVGVLPVLLTQLQPVDLVALGEPIEALTLDAWALAHESRRHSHKVRSLVQFLGGVASEVMR